MSERERDYWLLPLDRWEFRGTIEREDDYCLDRERNCTQADLSRTRILLDPYDLYQRVCIRKRSGRRFYDIYLLPSDQGHPREANDRERAEITRFSLLRELIRNGGR